MQEAFERGGAGLVYFAFDLLEIEGENLMALPLSERKSRLASLLTKPPNGIKFSDHEGGGEAFRRAAYRHGLEGLVGWSDPEGTRPFLGSLLYAGRVGTGMSQETLALHHRRLKPLKTNQPGK
jgi:ATP-dependent DNA ligase